jgi:hypothetical protein
MVFNHVFQRVSTGAQATSSPTADAPPAPTPVPGAAAGGNGSDTNTDTNNDTAPVEPVEGDVPAGQREEAGQGGQGASQEAVQGFSSATAPAVLMKEHGVEFARLVAGMTRHRGQSLQG